jgi:hypothetical protein
MTMPPRTFAPLLLLVALGGACAGAPMPAASQGASAPMAAAEAMADAPSLAASPPPPPGAVMAMAKETPGKPEAKGAAEVATWKRSQLGAHTVHVRVGDHEELPIRSMQANVTLDGTRARVVLDMVVKNDRGGNYEGTFQLRLPEGASPYFFAFGEQQVQIAADAPVFFKAAEARAMSAEPAAIMAARASLWSGPKEARMVPREQAALAYRDTVRRAVDPAILEWSGPGIFSARVFPLAQNRAERIVVGYDVPLNRIGGDLEYVFDLPEGVGSKVVDIAVTPPAGAVLDTKPLAAPVLAAGRSWLRYEDPSAKEIVLRLRNAPPAHLVSAAGYFSADVVPTIPATAAAPGAEAALFLVDTSLSANPDRFNIWLKLMEAVLRNNRDTIKRFDVEFFSVDQHFWKPAFVANDDASVAELLAEANGLALEGATDLNAALRRAAAAPALVAAPGRYDVFLLSDGASTWGESDPFVTTRALAESGIAAVYAYQTGLAGTDTAQLSFLSRELGGAVFSVAGDAEVKSASMAHRARPLKLLEARVKGVHDVLLGGRPRFLFPGQSLRVVGRGKPDQGADLELTLETGAGKQTVRVPLGAPIASPLASRAYGQVATAQLEELLPATDALAPAYAREFRVTGKTCSLLMLESEADYQRFNIHPVDDAAVIGKTPAADAVAQAFAAVAGKLGDPKRAFVRWLAELPRRSGVTFDLPAGLAGAIERMPAASFRVDAAPLQVTVRKRAALPEAVQQALAAHHVEYDAISAEAARRLKEGGAGDALKALSSLVEESPGDAVLARDVGMSAMAWGLPAQAFHLFRRVGEARPFEPPTYRAEAMSLVRLGKVDLAIATFEAALAGHWAGRFGDFHQIVAVEYRELLRRVIAGELTTSVPDFARERFAAVSAQVPVKSADLVVMITWNTDGTDVDLHVVEPSGEECYYSHRNTASGGQLTQDVTQGYGPEMYVLPSAPAGRYQIRAHYFASDRNRASARTKVQALIFEDFGTPKQRVTEKTVVLDYGKQTHDLLDVVRGKVAQVAAP